MSTYKLSISSSPNSFSFSALVLAYYLNSSRDEVEVEFGIVNEGCILTRADGLQVDEGESVVRMLANSADAESTSTQGEALLSMAKTLPTTKDFAALTSTLDSLDDHLALRTFLDGSELTVVDWFTWGSIKGSLKPLGVMKGGKHPHLLRWFNYIEFLPSTQSALADLAESKTRSVKAEKSGAAASFGLGLQNAEMGKVVTRFPPEPSGYLHIGHLKAAILNQYFAEMYKGRLLVRFDDTNPSKEKSEFEESILEDLAVLNIHGKKISHTSDYFDQLYDYAIQIIKEGKAYVDDSDRETMKHERMEGIESRCRNLPVEENLRRFEKMKTATEFGAKCCLRAKISVDDPNKAMRDPVIYRCNPEPHHRTGDKWKVYPTYDFACPIVDSIEGVTHALRTNEYRDRNPQYQWMLDALGLRKVHIWDFSRVAFVYTFLSKRKLRECLELGLARGWDDPRFPTFRGIRRRGMTAEALRQFMLAQGPSQNQVLLEWDSIWTINKKIIDPIAPRFVAIAVDNTVEVTVQGGPDKPEYKSVPRHKKNADIGTKRTLYSSTILLEQEDAQSFADNEEITLMDWGNAIIRKISRSSSGNVITHIDMELHLEGDFKATEKKITWLAKSSPSTLVRTTLLDYDYLVTKRKLEKDDESVAAIANPQTEFCKEALADANVLGLKEGDIIQFERKGYFILDKIEQGEESEGKSLHFIQIPDGRASGLALKSGVPTPAATPAAAKEKTPVPADRSGADGGINMYRADMIVVPEVALPTTNMYKFKSVYEDWSL